MKRLTSFLLAIVLFAGLVLIGAPTAHAASAMTVSDSMVNVLKQEEGFAAKPYWDYSQWTVGYGTVCPSDMVEYYTENGITEEAAEVLLRNYLANTENTINRNFIDKYNLTLTQGQFDALVSFTYNCGTSWIYETSGTFHNAVKNGATGSELIRAFSLWCKAGDQILPGLVRRRLSEASMFLEGHYARYAPSNYCYVYYHANGGSVSYRIQGYDANLGTAPAYTPSKSGETFQGWYTAQVGGTKVDVLTQDLSGMTLYAHWGSQQTDSTTTETQAVNVVVTGNYVNLRKGPGTNYGIIGSVNAGAALTITETAEGSGYRWGNAGGKWICLSYTNYDAALAAMEQAKQETTEPEETTPEETTPEETVPETTEPKPTTVTGTVKANGGLALRTGPGTGYSLIRYLANGSRITVLEQSVVGSMTWGKLSDGWVSLSYVILDEPIPEPTEPEVTEPEVTEPEVTEPETTEPETTVPETTVPETTVPETTVPEVTVPEVTVPETTVPETTVPEVTVPEETIPEETIPETTVPEETIPEETVPETTVPEETIPEPTIPETTAPAAPASVSGTVKANGGLAVRNGAGTSYSVRRYLANGSRVTVTEQTTANGLTWGKISDGWICMNYVTLDGANTAVTKTVIADCLRVRSGAGTGNSVVGYVYYGASVTVYETVSAGGTTWGRISSGWVSMDYLR